MSSEGAAPGFIGFSRVAFAAPQVSPLRVRRNQRRTAVARIARQSITHRADAGRGCIAQQRPAFRQ
jgi:hypothetical protein